MRYYQIPSNQTVIVGVATEAKQDTGNSSLSSIDGKFTTLNAKDFATTAKQDTGNSSLTSIDGKFTTLNAKDFATTAKQDTGNSSLTSIDGKFTILNAKDFSTSSKQDSTNTKLDSIITNTSATSSNTALTVVDQIDTTALLVVSSSNIPASSSNSLSLVASTAAAIKRIITVEDIGEFMGLYSGPVETPTLLCILPLGGGEIPIAIPMGTLVSIRNMKNSAITSGYLAINFLG